MVAAPALKGGKLDNRTSLAKQRKRSASKPEYVNQFFKDKAKDTSYLTEMKNEQPAKALRAC